MNEKPYLSRQSSLLVVTGGGTGGHLFPALAVVEAVQDLRPDQEILYIGRDAERDRREVEQRNIPFAGLPLMGLRRRITIENLKALWLFWRGVAKAKRLMRMYRNGVVFGVGGYVSAPAMIAGKRLGWPVCLHEQNTLPGLVNRTLARRCDQVYATYESSKQYLNNPNCKVTGFPLRKSILEAAANGETKQSLTVPHVLLLGGSQGARKLVELSNTVFQLLDEQNISYTGTVQTGERNFEMAKAMPWSGRIELVPFIDNMADAYRHTDIIISRAGAGSLAEIALWRIPSILVPYPYASGNHQERNAQEWQESGAAILLREPELTAETLTNELAGLLTNEGKRKDMHGCAASLARSDAAQTIARDLIRMLEENE